MVKEKVIIVGGGVAGLTAAHELIERDFEVHVYERREFFGGKAASTRDSNNFPCEHGFRFYPAWYRHLPDTMSRIPYFGRRAYQEAQSVVDNLVAVDHELLTWYGRDPVRLLTRIPRNLDQAKTLRTAMTEFTKLGLGSGELAFFAHRMAQFLVMPDAQRAEELEQVTWWSYLEADTKSQAYQDLIAATTRLMVAAKAKEASAYTIGRLALRTFADTLATVDRVMTGPTNELWINPWVEHLKGLGVHFHTGWELESVQFDDQIATPTASAPKPPYLNKIASVSFSRLVVQQVRRLGRLLPVIAWAVNGLVLPDAITDNPQERTHDTAWFKRALADNCKSARSLVRAIKTDPFWNSWRFEEPNDRDTLYVERLNRVLAPLDKIIAFIETIADTSASTNEGLGVWALGLEPLLAALSLATGEPTTGEADAGDDANVDKRRTKVSQTVANGIDAAVRVLALLDSTAFAKDRSAGTNDDYFIFALPLEQMAYYVNRSVAMTEHDPSLRRIVRLSEYMDWMAGIQFYLKEPFRLVAGHIVCMDSNWSLTAIEEAQFWRDSPLKVKVQDSEAEVKAVLSVDIAAWDRKGRFVNKEAFNCTADEIATEVWNELKAAIERQTTTQRLRDDMLLGRAKPGQSPLVQGVNYHLDDSIADVYDRKKQAAYENARSVEFDADELIRRQGQSGAASQMPYIWGARRQFNVEPLLVNRAGSRALRPEAQTAIPNMFLAGDYVRTETDLACMEGANEAARRAVNALLDAAASMRPRCPVWDFSIARDVLERLTQVGRIGDAFGVGTRAAQTAGRVTDAVMSFASQALANLQSLRMGNGKPRTPQG